MNPDWSAIKEYSAADSSAARESESLRKQLEAAWELCRTLQSRIRDQEELRARDQEELRRLRGVGEDLRRLRTHLDWEQSSGAAQVHRSSPIGTPGHPAPPLLSATASSN